MYRVVFDEIHKVITDIGYREAFALFSRLNLSGVTLFGSSASIPDHLIPALFQLTKTPWRVIRTPSNRKELVYQVQTFPEKSGMVNYLVQYWDSIKTYGQCLLFGRTIDVAKELAETFHVLPFIPNVLTLKYMSRVGEIILKTQLARNVRTPVSLTG